MSIDAAATICTLRHPAFARLGRPLFRRAETDGMPVMVVQLGERDAAVPLRALQREFSIDDDSADGRMLGLIAEALDFVGVIRLGDALPAEVLTGEASWQPDPLHLSLALARLRLQLVGWLLGDNAESWPPDPQALLALVEEPGFRPKIQQAFERAAAALDLPDADAVVTLMGELAQELAYIEALRDRLLRRVRLLGGRIGQMNQRWRGDWTHAETLQQVQRLTTEAIKQIGARFEQLDTQTNEVLSALRNTRGHRAFIRAGRDWLYRSLLAWQNLLRQWDEVAATTDRELWQLVERTYKFLAPRFMSVTEWISMIDPRRREASKIRMVW